MTRNYGAEIRELANEYEQLCGKSSPFIGVENWTASIKTYMFTERNFSSGEEALGYMRRLLDDEYKDFKPLHQWRPKDELPTDQGPLIHLQSPGLL